MAGTLSVQKIQGLATSATPTVVEVSSGHTLHQAGAVLQVLQEAKTAAVSVSSGANSGIISKAITPKFSTSKILVRCSLSLAGAINSYGYCRLFRQISGQSAGVIGVGDQASGSQVNASFYLNRSDTVVTDNVWTPSQMSTLTLIEVAQ